MMSRSPHRNLRSLETHANSFGRRLVLLLALARVLFGPTSAFAEINHQPPTHLNNKTRAILEQRIRDGISADEPWLGLVGDSSITGAATSLDLQPSWFTLAGVVLEFLGESIPESQQADIRRIPFANTFVLNGRMDPAVRVLYSQKEFQQAKAEGREIELNLESKGSLRLDIPEYSFGYLTGRRLGFPAHRIVLVGQNGQRVDSIYKQMGRFSELSPTLPSHLIIMYTANDVCGDEVDQPLERFKLDFETRIRKELDQAIANLTPHTLGTKVVVVAPLDVAQLLTNEELFKQVVDFQGYSTATCGELRKGTVKDSLLGREMQKTLHGMCRAILGTDPNDGDRIGRIRQFQLAQISIWKKILASYQNTPKWSFQFTEASRKPRFQLGDVANDCFHPGPGAHSRIAIEVSNELLSNANGK